ncbi:MAG: phosphatidylserine decarboxylase [Bacteroidales bacterium]|nr:phosphatidylserine decarboxylase [Bacteroidales bacterium]
MNRKTKFIRYIIPSLLLLLALLALYPTPDIKPVRYIDRKTNQIKTEKVAGEGWLTWLYHNPIGKLTLQTLVKRKFISDWYGNRMDSPNSVNKIETFVEDYNVDLSIAQKHEFNSFNDFFTRKLKPGSRPVNMNSNVVVSPADGKVLAYSNVGEQDFFAKGYRFNVSSFLQSDSLADVYKHGSLMIFRLSPPDYHRFHFPLSGHVSSLTKIEGDYYSVNPIAIRKMIEIFCENKREYVIISNPGFGDVIMAEVGATLVGSIIQTYSGDRAIKGEEKGYFKFGGSTVLLLFKKDEIEIDPDLLINSQNQLETSVVMGEKVGETADQEF